jgi:hypothetical protein
MTRNKNGEEKQSKTFVDFLKKYGFLLGCLGLLCFAISQDHGAYLIEWFNDAIDLFGSCFGDNERYVSVLLSLIPL